MTGFDAAAWHTLGVTARENVVTATLDGAQLTSYIDTSPSPVLAGRVALVSGYYNTRYDNLAVKPIKGQAWQSEKVDDADSRVAYPDGFSFAQVGFAHLNRTHHVLTAGQSLALDFTGTGLNLFGATGSATLEVRVDDQEPCTAQVGAVDTRQTSYWLRELCQCQHKVTARVVTGTFTLDGIDVVDGRALNPQRY